jgi:asparagine synthase (glutamine-hydrolysing)
MRLIGDKMHKAARVLASRSMDELYRGLVSQWDAPERLVIGGAEAHRKIGMSDELEGLGAVERMMVSDMLTYLPDDILTKVDRAAMSISLESRVPFLDHRVVEFAWRLPTDLKLRNGETKWVLRRMLDRYVPAALIERPKMGFGVPIDSWLRGALRPWAEALIAPDRLAREGYFNPAMVQREWQEHCRGRHNGQHRLWTVLMFQQWLEYGKALREPPPSGLKLGRRAD